MPERAVAAAPATRDDAPSLPPSPAAGSGRAAADYPPCNSPSLDDDVLFLSPGVP